MDIEQLTKAQIILLTLLVSFVTSIATGIVTVTLVDQAPPVVTQTISRVVERTIERVVSDEGQAAGAGVAVREVIKEVQVVVRESDLVTDAVAKVSKSLVRIYVLDEGQSNPSDIRGEFLGLGLIISRDGLILTDSTVVAPGEFYAVSTADGSLYSARLENESGNRTTAILTITLPEGRDVVFPPVAFADLSSLKLGQSVIMLSGASRTSVSVGIVADVISHSGSEGANIIDIINTSIGGEPVLGAPLVDLLGEVTGIYTVGNTSVTGVSYTSNTIVRDQLAEVFAIDAEGR